MLDLCFFANETIMVDTTLIWDTAISEILDEGDSESEAGQEAGSSEEDEDDDEEEDEDGKRVTGTLLGFVCRLRREEKLNFRKSLTNTGFLFLTECSNVKGCFHLKLLSKCLLANSM